VAAAALTESKQWNSKGSAGSA